MNRKSKAKNKLKLEDRKETPKENVRLILLKDIFYYYIIILLFFCYKRGYGMTERSEFILIEIKGYYNTNDRWKFFFFFIRRENDINK